MKKIVSIYLDKVEGKHEDCFDVTVNSLAKANKMLAMWAQDAPTSGYDKTDFIITWEDGEKYKGRFDIVHISKEQPDLADHVLGHLEYVAGVQTPIHMSREEYVQHLALFGKKAQAQAKDFLDNYQIA